MDAVVENIGRIHGGKIPVTDFVETQVFQNVRIIKDLKGHIKIKFDIGPIFIHFTIDLCPLRGIDDNEGKWNFTPHLVSTNTTTATATTFLLYIGNFFRNVSRCMIRMMGCHVTSTTITILFIPQGQIAKTNILNQ